MDAVGTGSQAALDAELAEFARTSDAVDVLQHTYASLPRQAAASRFRTVYIAGQIATPAAVKFLADVALSAPDIVAASAGHGEVTDQGFQSRYTASTALVHHYVAAVPNAAEAVEQLLGNADPEIAKGVGVELFSQGKLSEAWRSKLKSRNIFADFKAIEGAELDKLRTLDVEHAGHQGASKKTRVRVSHVAVPPASE